MTQQGKQNLKNPNLSRIQDWKTQKCKARTWYMLEDDSNKSLF